jgi:hypothetical protein
MDDGNGISATDSSPSGRDGTITDALWEQGVILCATSVAGSGDDDKWGDKSPRMASFPNPFSRATALAQTLPSPPTVQVTVHDLAGRVVRVINNRRLDAETHTFEWDGRNSTGMPVAAGVYFCRTTSEHGSAIVKMVLLR